MRLNYIIFLSMLLLLASCAGRGTISVKNDLPYVTLDDVSWGEYNLTNSLTSGETTVPKEIVDEKNKYPKMNPLEFYMVRAGKRVCLRTKQIYTMDNDGDLLIVIKDTTAVVNPF